ncbi:MAG: PAS domain-containing sensor histidine kinase [Myxococcales bacterium]|nr:PAS domain-containing sensor histidine kinase [Myxococcales bacterium]
MTEIEGAIDIEDVPDAVLVIEGGAVRRVNGRAATLLGAPASAWIGRPVASVLAEDELARLFEVERQQAAHWALPETFRARLRHASGHSVLVDLRFSRSGERWVLSARDMTETSRGEGLISRLADLAGRFDDDVEALLRAAEPHFVELGWTLAYSVVEGAHVIPTHVLGSADDPVAQYGRAILGQRLDRAASPIASEVVATGQALFLDNLPSTRTAPLRLAEALDEHMREAKVRRSVWCPIWREGAVVAVLAMAGSDLTDHDFVAIQLLAAQLGAIARAARLRAEIVRRSQITALGEVGALLAHELRHPIAVVMASLGMLGRETALSAAGMEALRVVQEETIRLRHTIADVLGFARPLDLRLELVPVLPLVEEVLASIRHVHPTRAIDVQIDPSHGVRADRELLRRVLLNVVENACIHAAPGAAIALRTSVADGACRLVVFNEGAPLDPLVAQRVFEPFFTTHRGGSGLGLHVAQQGLSAMGGRAEFEPIERGVQLSLCLPCAPPPKRPSAP